MSSQQPYNKTDRQYPTLGGRQEDRTRPYFSGKSKARGGKKLTMRKEDRGRDHTGSEKTRGRRKESYFLNK